MTFLKDKSYYENLYNHRMVRSMKEIREEITKSKAPGISMMLKFKEIFSEMGLYNKREEEIKKIMKSDEKKDNLYNMYKKELEGLQKFNLLQMEDFINKSLGEEEFTNFNWELQKNKNSEKLGLIEGVIYGYDSESDLNSTPKCNFGKILKREILEVIFAIIYKTANIQI